MTPTGVIDHGVTEETEAEKAFMQNLVPYRYWYTVNCDSDIHVDMAECPEDIWDIISAATGQSFEQKLDEYVVGTIDFDKIIPQPEGLYMGDLGEKERQIYKDNNWYDWRHKHWGTKWNSYGYEDGVVL